MSSVDRVFAVVIGRSVGGESGMCSRFPRPSSLAAPRRSACRASSTTADARSCHDRDCRCCALNTGRSSNAAPRRSAVVGRTRKSDIASRSPMVSSYGTSRTPRRLACRALEDARVPDATIERSGGSTGTSRMSQSPPIRVLSAAVRPRAVWLLGRAAAALAGISRRRSRWPNSGRRDAGPVSESRPAPRSPRHSKFGARCGARRSPCGSAMS